MEKSSPMAGARTFSGVGKRTSRMKACRNRMMDRRTRLALLAAVVAVMLALSGLAYLWLLTRDGVSGSACPVERGGATPPPETPSPADENVTLEAVRIGLAYPIALAFASDGRVFYAERHTGRIQILRTDTPDPTTFYTLTGTNSVGERGLLGLALDPGFPATPFVYAYQTYNDEGSGSLYNRIVRIQASGDLGVSHTVLLQLPPPQGPTNHNGGVIAFGPDGKLYAVVGEQANPSHSQDRLSPLGKVLRMNSDGSAPADNPHIRDANWHPLVYTHGHRNMFGLTFHPTSGQAYITENGPSDNDEINCLIPGGNYGWPNVRGVANNPAYIDPIQAYARIIAPTNAAFYTANVPAAYRNQLVFGTYLSNELRALALDPDGSRVVSEAVLATATDAIIEVEMGRDGYLWVTTPTAIYRLVPTETPPISVPPGAV
jgi:glucose/arabinose dehydrogenase